jgi:signal transduction histidine kinase
MADNWDQFVGGYAIAQENRLELRIVDNGTGIEDGDFDTIFEEGCSRTGSSGFGLYIVRKFAKLGGGSASATQKPPPGAQFNVTITNFTFPNP